MTTYPIQTHELNLKLLAAWRKGLRRCMARNGSYDFSGAKHERNQYNLMQARFFDDDPARFTAFLVRLCTRHGWRLESEDHGFKHRITASPRRF